MEKLCFQLLCDKIIKAGGKEEFKSESYIDRRRSRNVRFNSILSAQEKTSGGFICGEVRLALTLRLLAGSSYLDADDIFHVKPNHTYARMHYVLENWICNDDVIVIDIMSYLNDEEEMNKNAIEFGHKTNNIFTKVI